MAVGAVCAPLLGMDGAAVEALDGSAVPAHASDGWALLGQLLDGLTVYVEVRNLLRLNSSPVPTTPEGQPSRAGGMLVVTAAVGNELSGSTAIGSSTPSGRGAGPFVAIPPGTVAGGAGLPGVVLDGRLVCPPSGDGPLPVGVGATGNADSSNPVPDGCCPPSCVESVVGMAFPGCWLPSLAGGAPAVVAVVGTGLFGPPSGSCPPPLPELATVVVGTVLSGCWLPPSVGGTAAEVVTGVFGSPPGS